MFSCFQSLVTSNQCAIYVSPTPCPTSQKMKPKVKILAAAALYPPASDTAASQAISKKKTQISIYLPYNHKEKNLLISLSATCSSGKSSGVNTASTNSMNPLIKSQINAPPGPVLKLISTLT